MPRFGGYDVLAWAEARVYPYLGGLKQHGRGGSLCSLALMSSISQPKLSARLEPSQRRKTVRRFVHIEYQAHAL